MQYTIDKWLKIFDKAHVVSQLLTYFRDCYSVIADYAVPQLLQSLALIPVAKRFNLVRLRKHILLYWDAGWLKSTILQHFASFVPPSVELTIESSFSDAVVRGSAARGRFIPPLAVKDLVVVPELNVALIKDEILQILLSVLENDRITVRLVKLAEALAEIDEDTRLWLAQKGIEVVDANAISYVPQMTMWTASHTLESINDNLRDAILSRFTVVHIPTGVLASHIVDVYRGMLRRDPEYEAQLREGLERVLSSWSLSDKDVATIHKWVEDFLKSLLDEGYLVTPRDASEMLKTAIAVSVLYGASPAPRPFVEDALGQLKEFLLRESVEERVLKLLASRPMTTKEIAKELGVPYMRAYRLLKRLERARLIVSAVRVKEKGGKEYVWTVPA